MSTSNFNLRNINPHVMSLLKKEANQKKMSVNSLIMQVIEKSLGVASPTKKVIFHDLDYLAGSWSQEDSQLFDDKVKSFQEIDEEFWR